MKVQIDIPHRYACMRAHTATHILHAELWKIFPQTKQAGSYVWTDELRFDFFAERSLTTDELQHIILEVNKTIAANHIVSVDEMSYEDAIKTGAKAFFEDTYPEIVRVVSIWTGLSVELCGGTHVSETSQIGSFFVTEQTAVAAWVKRIVALTWPKVAAHAQSLQSDLDSVAIKMSVPVKQLDAKIEKILNEYTDIQKRFDKLARATVEGLDLKTWTLSNYSFDTLRDYNNIQASILDFAQIVDHLKSLWNLNSRLLYTSEGQYAMFHPQAKLIVKELWCKGGGSDSFMQGRDEKIIWLL
jgi:alanyl-tRNA synthetase